MSDDLLDMYGFPVSASEALYLERRHGFRSDEFWKRRAKLVEEQLAAQCQDAHGDNITMSAREPEAAK